MADNTSDAYRTIKELLNDLCYRRFAKAKAEHSKRLARMRSILENNPGVVLEQGASGHTLLQIAALVNGVDVALVNGVDADALSLEYSRVLISNRV